MAVAVRGGYDEALIRQVFARAEMNDHTSALVGVLDRSAQLSHLRCQVQGDERIARQAWQLGILGLGLSGVAILCYRQNPEIAPIVLMGGPALALFSFAYAVRLEKGIASRERDIQQRFRALVTEAHGVLTADADRFLEQAQILAQRASSPEKQNCEHLIRGIQRLQEIGRGSIQA